MTMRSRTLLSLLSGALLGFWVAISSGVLADRVAVRSVPAGPVEFATDVSVTTSVSPPRTAALGTAFAPTADAALLGEVMRSVQREYVDAVPQDKLLESAVRGLIGSLDPYSAFLDPAEYAELKLSTGGSYPGIGIEVTTAEDAIKVVRPFEGSPAAAAGIRGGDTITAIDGRAVGTDLEKAIERMRGPAGSPVLLAVRRAGELLPLEFRVQRSEVEVHSVIGVMLQPGYAYLRIASFSETTGQDFAATLARLQRVNRADLRGVVLDLRNNPGGVLESAVEVADQMLDKGVIVSADGRTAVARFTMRAVAGDSLQGARIAVLINGGSASAAEIVAAALQDHQRATLIGRKTFGKGSVQTVMPLSQGRAMKLTTSRYFTPSGRSIQGRGVAPDVTLDGSEPLPPDLDSAAGRAALATQDADVKAALDFLRHPPARRLTASAS